MIDREREGLKKVTLAWDAVILNFLMAVCELSAVLVTGSVYVRPDGVLVGPVPVRRCTNPIGGGTQGRGFLEAEGRVP